MPNILAIDTSASACSVGVLFDDHITQLHQPAPMQQSKQILTIIDQLLLQQHLSFSHLNAIAFGCGPGSFTGLRIAASVTQAIALAHQLPVIKISSLAALAQAAFMDLGWKNMLVAVDARMQEVYWAAYEINQDGLAGLLGNEQVSAPMSIFPPFLADWYGVGNGWDIYPQQMSYQPVEVAADRVPEARAILTLAKIKWAQGDVVSAEQAIPVYLRDDVANRGKIG